MRHTLAHILSGDGIEICAVGEPTPVAPGATARYASFAQAEADAWGAGGVRPDIALKQPGAAPKALLDGKPLSFVILNAEALERSADPLTMIQSWARCLRPRGLLLLGARIRSTGPTNRQPTPLAHLWADHKRRRTTACSEHLLADRLERDPDAFADPLNIALLLSYMATVKQFVLDEDSWALINASNRQAVEETLALEPPGLRHHALSLPVLIAGLDALNETGEFIVSPCDIARDRGLDPQQILICRRHPASILGRKEGRRVIDDEVSMVRRQLATFEPL
jgi:hypothetical protein